MPRRRRARFPRPPASQQCLTQSTEAHKNHYRAGPSRTSTARPSDVAIMPGPAPSFCMVACAAVIPLGCSRWPAASAGVCTQAPSCAVGSSTWSAFFLNQNQSCRQYLHGPPLAAAGYPVRRSSTHIVECRQRRRFRRRARGHSSLAALVVVLVWLLSHPQCIAVLGGLGPGQLQ